jgi:hypothetical protein
MLGPMIEFQPMIFVATFSITQLISLKYPEMKFFLMRREKRIRVHHAFTGGLVALATTLIGQPFLFNVSLGVMIQDVFNHSLKILRKRFKF